MFIKFRKKIFNSIFTVLTVFVILLSAISCTAISKSLYDFEKARTKTNAETCIRSLETYLTGAMGFVENVSKNENIVKVVSGQELIDISYLLNGLCDYAVKIDGACLYGFDGYIAYSAGIGSPPSLDNLKNVDEINNFILSENKTSLVSLRKSAICQIYDHNQYPSEKGIISCIAKVFDGNLLKGLIVADIKPETLYRERLVTESFESQALTFAAESELLTDSDLFTLHYKNILQKNDAGVNIFRRTDDGKYYCVSAANKDNIKIVIFAPLKNFYKRIIMIFVLFFGVDAVLIISGMFFARFVSFRAVKPLDELYDKMTNVMN